MAIVVENKGVVGGANTNNVVAIKQQQHIQSNSQPATNQQNPFSSVINGVLGIFNSASSDVKQGVNDIVNGAKTASGYIANGVKTVANDVKTIGNDVSNTITPIINKAQSYASGFPSDISTLEKGISSSIDNTAKTIPTDISNSIKDLSSIPSDISKIESTSLNNFATGAIASKIVFPNESNLSADVFGLGNVYTKEINPAIAEMGDVIPALDISSNGVSFSNLTQQATTLTTLTGNLYSTASLNTKLGAVADTGLNIASDLGFGFGAGYNPLATIGFAGINSGITAGSEMLSGKNLNMSDIETSAKQGAYLGAYFNIASYGLGLLGKGISSLSTALKSTDELDTGTDTGILSKITNFKILKVPIANTLKQSIAMTGAETGIEDVIGNEQTPSQIAENLAVNTGAFFALNLITPAIISEFNEHIKIPLNDFYQFHFNDEPSNLATDIDLTAGNTEESKVFTLNLRNGETEDLILNTRPNMGTNYDLSAMESDLNKGTSLVNVNGFDYNTGDTVKTLSDLNMPQSSMGSVRGLTPSAIESSLYFQTDTNGVKTADLFYKLGTNGESSIDADTQTGSKFINMLNGKAGLPDVTLPDSTGYTEEKAVELYNKGQIESDKPLSSAYQNAQSGGSETQLIGKPGAEITNVERVGHLNIISESNSFYSDFSPFKSVNDFMSSHFPYADIFDIKTMDLGPVKDPTLMSYGSTGEPIDENEPDENIKSAKASSISSPTSGTNYAIGNSLKGLLSFDNSMSNSNNNLKLSISKSSSLNLSISKGLNLKTSSNKNTKSRGLSSSSNSKSNSLSLSFKGSLNSDSSLSSKMPSSFSLKSNSSKSSSSKSSSSKSSSSSNSKSSSSSGSSNSSNSSSSSGSYYPIKKYKDLFDIKDYNIVIKKNPKVYTKTKNEYGRMSNIFGVENFAPIVARSEKQYKQITSNLASEDLIRPIIIKDFKANKINIKMNKKGKNNNILKL